MKEYNSFLQLFLKHLDNYKAGISHKKPNELYQPCNYMLSLGGKRIRPLLALVACDLFDKKPEQALNSALAVELFHNFSLIHDDILDNAPLRRNKPTVHIKWNHNIAILSGDALLVESSKVLNNYAPSAFKKLSELFHATATEVCEGQQQDMNFETAKKVTTEQYIHMIELKTAVLLGCSLKMGAICAGTGKRNQDLLYDFGKNLGIAFQLLDDYLDAFAASDSNFGKQVGGDIIANKKTYLLLKSIELANAKQKREIEQLLLLKGKNASKKVNAFLNLYKQLSTDRLCYEAAGLYTNAAIASLQKVKASAEKKKVLMAFALELINRQA
ncbi:MAG: polyprenyl synthetase family protein [Bacteroidia bacterium]|nr:polyprenyl synthetase family protein [Bacteroidia bacterium]